MTPPATAARPRSALCLFTLVLIGFSSPVSARGPQMSEAERNAFEQQQVKQAELACKASDYKAFFHLMVQSATVRRTFTAQKIEYAEIDAKGEGRSTLIPRDTYDRFPIRMVDYQWRSTRPAHPGDSAEHVVMVINRSQTNRVSVEWTRIHYRAPFIGEENLGTPYDIDGKRYDPDRSGHGQLLLFPKGDCWELAADIRRTSR